MKSSLTVIKYIRFYSVTVMTILREENIVFTLLPMVDRNIYACISSLSSYIYQRDGSALYVGMASTCPITKRVDVSPKCPLILLHF